MLFVHQPKPVYNGWYIKIWMVDQTFLIFSTSLLALLNPILNGVATGVDTPINFLQRPFMRFVETPMRFQAVGIRDRLDSCQ